MKLLVGLGNPGDKYVGNRHNIGFHVVDEIHDAHNLAPWKSQFQGLVSAGQVDGEKVTLLKPQTYMNESGRSVGEAARYFKIPLDEIFVFYDELDLAPGKVRVKIGGGSGGHNGIKSLDAHLGKDYQRIRIGIGHPGHKDRVVRYVLSDFAKADAEWLEPLKRNVAQAVPELIAGDGPKFMNALGRLQQADGPRTKMETTKPRTTAIDGAGRQSNAAQPASEGPMARALKALLGREKE